MTQQDTKINTRDYQRKWRARNPEKVKEYNRRKAKLIRERYATDEEYREYVKANSKRNTPIRRNKRQEWWTEYRRTLSCSKCGEGHIATIDFHHPDSIKKKADIRILFDRGVSIKRIEREIEKCIVLCSNCHRKLHWEERNNTY